MDALSDVLMPAADHVIPYHLLLSGRCHARLPDGEPVEVRAGEVVMFPAGDRHILATGDPSGLLLQPVDLSGENLRGMLKRGQVMPVREGNAGDATRIVCGFLACDGRMADPILSGLPRLLRVNLRDSGTAAWVQSSIQFSMTQSAAQRPGSAMALARLSEVLFAEAVRQYMDGLPALQTGWLRALALLHDQPAFAWTLDRLSRQVGLSRSALSDRFASLVGKAPMQYLTSWRLALAEAQLRRGEGSILSIATDVGYESEAAFSRAFKREFGSPPAAWRRKVAQSAHRRRQG